jgi:Bacteriocin-protection, YdeI or OmpD-Associated
MYFTSTVLSELSPQTNIRITKRLQLFVVIPGSVKTTPPAWERWQELSFTHQREYVEAIEEAKKPETRVRRIENAVRTIAAQPPKKRK